MSVTGIHSISFVRHASFPPFPSSGQCLIEYSAGKIPPIHGRILVVHERESAADCSTISPVSETQSHLHLLCHIFPFCFPVYRVLNYSVEINYMKKIPLKGTTDQRTIVPLPFATVNVGTVTIHDSLSRQMSSDKFLRIQLFLFWLANCFLFLYNMEVI